MNTRRDRLRSIFAGAEPAPKGEGTPADAPVTPTTPASSAAPQIPPRRTTSGAVKAMGLSLGSLSEQVQEAKKLRETLASGEKVVEIDTAHLERSPYHDRLTDGARDDEDFAALVHSMKEHGQQVPVLVRPHPDPDKAARGIYQIAYGHRRVLAARELGIPVRAIVRQLSDADLVVAQGKENAERRALSFIERAVFAKALIDHGFDRATAQAALSVHKSEMTRLLQVAEMVPLEVVRAVGPAPKAGRPRWMALGELLQKDSLELAGKTIRSPDFLSADSDTRFQRLFNTLEAAARSRSRAGQDGQTISSVDGKATIAELTRSGKAVRLTIPESAGRGFADYLARRLPEIHAEFAREEEGKAEQ